MRRLALLLVFSILSFCALPYAYAAEDKVYRSAPTEKKRIALTFDDGPHPKYTPKILDCLEKYGIHATFFVIGENVEYYGDKLIGRMLAAGHEIGNHTYTHGHTSKMRAEDFIRDVEKCHVLLREKYSYEPRLFRPPEGYVDSKVMSEAAKMGYSVILWSIDTRDWEHTTPSLIVGNVEGHISGGDIILMHDYVSRPNTTIDALERLIPSLISEGYEFLTVSELISEN